MIVLSFATMVLVTGITNGRGEAAGNALSLVILDAAEPAVGMRESEEPPDSFAELAAETGHAAARATLFRSFAGGPVDSTAAQHCSSPVEKDGACLGEVNLDGLPGVPSPFSTQMYVMPSDHYISGSVLTKHRVWEWENVQHMIEKMHQAQSGFFLDIGANLGSFSVPMLAWQQQQQQLGPKGRGVIAIDARHECTDLLSRTAMANSAMETSVLEATAEHATDSGLRKMTDMLKPIHGAMVQDLADFPNGVCTSGADNITTESNIGGTQTQVGHREFRNCHEYAPALTLDSLLEQNADMQKVVAVKLDCEGCEGNALLGGKKFLTEHPPCFLMFELTEKYTCESGTPWPKLRKYLMDMNYVSKTDITHTHEQEECDKIPDHHQLNTWWEQKNLQTCLSKFD